jgi:metal-sulfur cluster biosynthetic enzyme
MTQQDTDRASRSAAALDSATGADRTGAAGSTGSAQPPTAEQPTLDELEEAMRDVVDPELGINVVDLGLVYDIRLDGGIAILDMTLTSAACPLTDVIEDQTRAALVNGPGGGLVRDIKINWVWMPPWGPDKITDDGREQLRALGFTV